MHAELRNRYPDQYVAVYRGKVVDHDPDQLALFRRVEERYPDVPVLIRQVAPEQEEVYTFRSPRWPTSILSACGSGRTCWARFA